MNHLFARVAGLLAAGVAVAAYGVTLTVSGTLNQQATSSSCTYTSIDQDAQGNLNVTCGSGPKTITISPPLGGSVCTSFTSISQDAGGNLNVSGCVSSAPPPAPTVVLDAPATSGGTYAASVNFRLKATPTVPAGRTVTKVEFFRDGATLIGLGTLSSGQYYRDWAPAAGTYAVYAKVTDSTGATADSVTRQMIFTVANTPPVVTLTATCTTNPCIAPATVTLTATADDAPGTVARVEFWEATLLLSDTVAPYSHTVTGVTAGSHTYTAKAFDTSNAMGSQSATVVVTAAGNQAPVITSASATPGVFYGYAGSSVPLVVQASDPNGQSITVRFIDLRTGTVLGYGSQNGNTFTLNWNPPSGEGAYSVRAEASDGLATSFVDFGVAVMQKPAAKPVIPATPRPTSTVGAIPATFSVGENGSASYTIPIAIPPGPGGVQPSVSLNYNSNGPDGLLGMGWSIGGSSYITRCPATLATNGATNGLNYDSAATNDLYCLDGQRLIPVGDRQATGYSAVCGQETRYAYSTEYRTEIDTFSKVVAYEDDPCLVIGPSRFEVFTKDGRWMMYGLYKRAMDSNELGFDDGEDGKGAWVINWPTNFNQPLPNSVKTWPLARVIDRAGNFMKFEYCGTNLWPIRPKCQAKPPIVPPAPGEDPNAPTPIGSFPPTEHHLRTIFYGGRADRVTRYTQENPYAAVYFAFGRREDFDQHRYYDSGGGETTLSKYLHSITVRVEGVDTQSYFPWYEQAGLVTATDRRTLKSIRQCQGGVDHVGNPAGPCLESTKFMYSPGGMGAFSPVAMPTVNVNDFDTVGDLDGDGRTDLVYAPDGQTWVNVALASQNFEWRTRNLPDGYTIQRGSDRYLADFNGDGKADLIVKSGNRYVFCDLQLPVPDMTNPNGMVCKEPPAPNQIPEAVQGFYLKGDFDGDGRIDFLVYRGTSNGASHWSMHFGDRDTGMTAAYSIDLPISSNDDPLQLAMQFAIGDLNGDGRADFIYRKNPDVCRFGEGDPADPAVCEGLDDRTLWKICFSRPNGSSRAMFDCPVGFVQGPNGLLSNSVTYDFNGDGIADLAFPANPGAPSTLWNICLSNGNGSFMRAREPASSTPITLGGQYKTDSLCATVPAVKAELNKVAFGDFDGDGRTDIARIVDGTTTWTICYARSRELTDDQETPESVRSNNVIFTCKPPVQVFGGNVAGNIQTGDFNGDGKTDLFGHHGAGAVTKFNMALAPAGVPDLLTKVENGLKATTSIVYAPLTDSDVYPNGAASVGTYEVAIQSPMYVVRSTQESNARWVSGVEGTFNKTYTYRGLKGATNGRGLLGFASRDVEDSNGLVRTTEYNQSVAEWWKAGRPSRATTKVKSSGLILSDAKFEWEKVTTPNTTQPGRAIGYSVHPLSSVEMKADLDGSQVSCSRTLLYKAGDPAVPQVDEYGNIRLTQTATGSCDIAAGTFTVEHQQTVTNTYFQATAANWIVGRLACASVNHSFGGAAAGITRTSRFEYSNIDRVVPSGSPSWCTAGAGATSCPNAPQGHLCRETVEPAADAASDLRHETAYEYDARGNVTKTTQTFNSDGVQLSRVNRVTFEPKGRYPTLLVNAKDHLEERTYDLRFGALATSKKYFGGTQRTDFRQVTNFYDGFGRKIGERTTARDGSPMAETDIAWTARATADPVDVAYRTTTRTHTGSETTVTFDKLQRETRRESRGFSPGQTSFVTTEYNERGLKSKVEVPAGSGRLATDISYDDLDRVVSETTGTGTLSSSTTTAYNGRKVTVTRTNGGSTSRMSVSKRNAQGQFEFVKDCLDDATGGGDADCGGRHAAVTSYLYDATGNTKSITSPATVENSSGLTRTAEYDVRGRKIESFDPDLGTYPDQGKSFFTYNGAGELITHRYTQSASVGETKIVNKYDSLGRPERREVRLNNVLTSTADWTYDTCGTARFDGTACAVSSTDGTQQSQRQFAYDRYGRAYSSYLSVTLDGATRSGATYTLPDAQGRTARIVYPGFEGVKHWYNDDWAGDLVKITDLRNDATILWQATSRFLDGQIQQMSVGTTGVAKTYDGLGRVASITTPSNLSLQNACYSFDALGNLTSRGVCSGTQESFTYDALNRLTAGGGTSVAYDDAGNIKTRDSRTYTYASTSNRVQSVAFSPARQYVYDAVGNITRVNDASTGAAIRTVEWKPFNMPARITQGADVLSWTYDADFSRVTEVSTSTGRTTYFPGADFVEAPDGSRYRAYISTPEGVVGVIDSVSGVPSTKFYLRDHLGSVVNTIGSGGGASTFTVWGERNQTPTINGPYTQRGFTGHEMLDEVKLVHMNGRIYDPAIGKFLSADPIVQAPYNGQSFNRYSYVMNNPLSLTDPTGYASWWVQWRRPIAAAVASIAVPMAVTQIWGAALGVTEGMAIAEGISFTNMSASMPALGGTTTVGSVAMVAGGFAAGGIAGGNISSAIQGAAMAGLSAGFAGGPSIVSPDDFAKVAARRAMDFVIRRETDRFFKRRFGISGFGLDLGLTALSFAGDAVFGPRYRGHEFNDNFEFIDGMFSREGLGFNKYLGFNPWSLPAELADVTLQYRGLPSASGWTYLFTGDRNRPLLGYSLGGGEANVLASWGLGSRTANYAVSLPILQVGAPNTLVTLGSLDPVNGGLLGLITSPGAAIERGNTLLDHMSRNYCALALFGVGNCRQ